MKVENTAADLPIEKALTTKEAARFLGLSHRTLQDWRGDGKGPIFRRFGRAVRYLPSDLRAFMYARAFRNTGEAAMAT